MKTKFSEYYRPTDAEFKTLWENAFFAFDANILLNLYRYQPATRDQFVAIMRGLNDRIWQPNQAVLEYFNNKTNVIQEQSNAYNKIISMAGDANNKFARVLSSFSKHSNINVEKIKSSIDAAFSEEKRKISALKKSHPDYRAKDTPLTALTEIFDGRIGEAYSALNMPAIRKQIDERYRLRQPPGYSDEEKDEATKYGDAIIWMQLLEHAGNSSTDLIFVTDDLKEDWWLYHGQKIIGPRPELIREMREKAGVRCYIYNSTQFSEHASRFLKITVDDNVFEDIKETGAVIFKPTVFTRSLLDELAGTGLRVRKLRNESDVLTNEIEQIRNMPLSDVNTKILRDYSVEWFSVKDALLVAERKYEDLKSALNENVHRDQLLDSE